MDALVILCFLFFNVILDGDRGGGPRHYRRTARKRTLHRPRPCPHTARGTLSHSLHLCPSLTVINKKIHKKPTKVVIFL